MTPAQEGFSWCHFSRELNKCACRGRRDNHSRRGGLKKASHPVTVRSCRPLKSHIISHFEISTSWHRHATLYYTETSPVRSISCLIWHLRDYIKALQGLKKDKISMLDDIITSPKASSSTYRLLYCIFPAVYQLFKCLNVYITVYSWV